MDYMIAVVLGVLASTVASLMFWLATFMLRPTLLFSDRVSRYTSPDGRTGYALKLLNGRERATKSDFDLKSCRC